MIMINNHIFSTIVMIASIALLICNIYKIRTREFVSLTQCVIYIIWSMMIILSVSLNFFQVNFLQVITTLNMIKVIMVCMSIYPFFDALVQKSFPNLYKKND